MGFGGRKQTSLRRRRSWAAPANSTTCYRCSNTSSSNGGAEWGRAVPSAGPSPAPSARSRACSRSISVSPVWRSAGRGQTPCSASTTPASPGTSGAVRSRAAVAGSSAPGIWSGIPRPSTRTGRPPTSCCGPIRTSASGSCTAAAIGHRRADPTGLWWPVAEVFDA
jgi:hypothetical protein